MVQSSKSHYTHLDRSVKRKTERVGVGLKEVINAHEGVSYGVKYNYLQSNERHALQLNILRLLAMAGMKTIPDVEMRMKN